MLTATPHCVKVTPVKESAEFSLTAGLIYHEYTVEFDTPVITPFDLLGACDGTFAIPLEGSGYGGPYNNRLIVSKVYPERLPGALSWTVKVTYDSNVPADAAQNGQEIWRTDFQSRGIIAEEEIIFDFSDGAPNDGSGIWTFYTLGDDKWVITNKPFKKPSPIVNTAGDPINPKITGVYVDEEMTISYRTSKPRWQIWADTRGKVNTDALQITVNGESRPFAPYTLYCADAVCKTAYEGGKAFWDVVLTIIYRSDTWITKIPNEGFNVIATTPSAGNPNQRDIIKDAFGKRRLERIRVDRGDGVRLPTSVQQYIDADGVQAITDISNNSDWYHPGAWLGFWRFKKTKFAGLLGGLDRLVPPTGAAPVLPPTGPWWAQGGG